MLSFKGSGQLTDTLDRVDTILYNSPVDHTIRLAGSFGELRSNHFHAGIDIKSLTGEEGDTVRACAPGYISRIKIQSGGYGRVLYLDHPDGRTSVYAHMREFEESLEKYITSKQIEAQSYEVDVYPEIVRFPFSKGEPLGLMGNTGRSYGPHLHFEIRDTKTEIPLNPYLLGIGPEDTRPPLLYAVDVHGLNSDHQKIWQKTQHVQNGKNGHEPEVTFKVPAWRAGIAIQTFDLMNGASNKNGIFSIEVKVDDSLHFFHKMNRVGFDVTKYINSHIEYSEKKVNNRTVTKCYVSPGNKLDFYSNVINKGEIKLYKEKKRKIDISIKDYFDNETTYTCYLLRRDALPNELSGPVFQKIITFNSESQFNLGSTAFYFPENSVDKKTYISYKEKMNKGLLEFDLNEKSCPLFSYPVVSIPVHSVDTSLYSKLVLVHENKTSYGGVVDGDSLRVRIGQFGNFKIMVDTIPPKLIVGSFLTNAQNKPFFRFEISDNFETKGYAKGMTYDVFIDGQWVISPMKALGNTLIVPLKEISPGKHSIKIRLEDHSGNTTIWQREFTN